MSTRELILLRHAHVVLPGRDDMARVLIESDGDQAKAMGHGITLVFHGCQRVFRPGGTGPAERDEMQESGCEL